MWKPKPEPVSDPALPFDPEPVSEPVSEPSGPEPTPVVIVKKVAEVATPVDIPRNPTVGGVKEHVPAREDFKSDKSYQDWLDVQAAHGHPVTDSGDLKLVKKK